MKIDAHHHLWQPARGDYDWMPNIDVLNRPYGPQDLAPTLQKAEIDGTIIVQAAASIEETEYMLGLADATPWIKGVVGWIDFDDRMHLAHLRRLARHPRFVGVRPMIQDIEDTDWMLRDNVQWAYQAVIDLDLSFDVLGTPRHLENVLTLALKFPDLRMVCDHCMKPLVHQAISPRAFSDWANGMNAIAQQTNAFVKLSSLATQAPENWTLETLRPFADHILSSFGPDRTMWGSDWPVCRLETEYDVALEHAQQFAAHLSDDEQAKIFGETAVRFYRIR
jgi:L-fuconolactonase